jgi:hypothetical protein
MARITTQNAFQNRNRYSVLFYNTANLPYISDVQPAARRCYVCGAQEFSEHNLRFSIKNKNHFFFSDLVNFASIVKSGKQCLSCNGIQAYCMGKYRLLEILQWEE